MQRNGCLDAASENHCRSALPDYRLLAGICCRRTPLLRRLARRERACWIHDSYIVMDPVFFGGFELQGWLLYAVPSGLGLLALGLAGAGVWLLMSRPDSPD